MKKEPAVMFCLECMFKHLRDTEHHLEDAVRVTEGKEREEFETMIDGIRLMRKVVFDKMRTSSDLPSSCPTCGAGSVLKPPEFRHDGGEVEQKKYTLVVDYGHYEEKLTSLSELEKEIIRLGKMEEAGDYAYFDVWVYDLQGRDITDKIFKEIGAKEKPIIRKDKPTPTPHEEEHCESETCQTFTEKDGEATSKNPVPKECSFRKEVMEDKKHFDKKSFRTLCPECPEARCSQCPPDLKCATRVIVGCPKGEYKEGRCQVGLEAQSIHHGE